MTQEDADRSICHLTAHRPQKQWSKTDSQALHRQKQHKLKCPEFQAHYKDQTCLQLSISMLTNACRKFIASAQVQQLHTDECKTVWAEVRLVAIWSGFVSGWKWVKWSCSNISQVSLKMWQVVQTMRENNDEGSFVSDLWTWVEIVITSHVTTTVPRPEPEGCAKMVFESPSRVHESAQAVSVTTCYWFLHHSNDSDLTCSTTINVR